MYMLIMQFNTTSRFKTGFMAVRRRLRSDSRIIAELSGGLDSPALSDFWTPVESIGLPKPESGAESSAAERSAVSYWLPAVFFRYI